MHGFCIPPCNTLLVHQLAPTSGLWLQIDIRTCVASLSPAADERDQLAEAMQVSLVEAEERKALEAPLEERDPDEILQVVPQAWF